MHRSAARLSSNYRSPGLPYRIHHPHVVDKSWETSTRNREASVSGLAKFIPKNFKMQSFVESVRTGEFLGTDYPYNLLPMSYWQKRKYNVDYKQVPENVSLVPRVDFYARLNVWSVAWKENGREYHRWFRVQVQGFKQAKYKAEAFKRMLLATGRVDNAKGAVGGGAKKFSREEYMEMREKRSKKFARTRLIRRGLF
jgi:hypothetical protein